MKDPTVNITAGDGYVGSDNVSFYSIPTQERTKKEVRRF
jgi:hypothetical protein